VNARIGASNPNEKLKKGGKKNKEKVKEKIIKVRFINILSRPMSERAN